MNFEDFKKEFDAALAAVSENDLIDAFEKMGCEFEPVEMVDLGMGPIFDAVFNCRSADPDFQNGKSFSPLTMAADSSDLALAA